MNYKEYAGSILGGLVGTALKFFTVGFFTVSGAVLGYASTTALF